MSVKAHRLWLSTGLQDHTSRSWLCRTRLNRDALLLGEVGALDSEESRPTGGDPDQVIQAAAGYSRSHHSGQASLSMWVVSMSGFLLGSRPDIAEYDEHKRLPV